MTESTIQDHSYMLKSAVDADGAGKSIRQVHSLYSIDPAGHWPLEQKEATVLHIDNNGALNMANQRQPTKSTRHIDIKQFAIQDWVESDLLLMRRIGHMLHHRHMDYMMSLANLHRHTDV